MAKTKEHSFDISAKLDLYLIWYNSNMEWKVKFYQTQNHKSPVEDWLKGLDIKTQSKIIKNLTLLEKFNLNLKQPYVKPLENKLYEIRTKDSKGIYRIIYFAHTGKQFIMLNGFTKKTQKTPMKEIELAKRRMKEFINEWFTKPN